jgi:ankyrin repeat protein
MPRPRLTVEEWDCAQRVFQRQRVEDIRSFLHNHPKCVHHTNHLTQSPLVYAILTQNTILAEILIEMGADIHNGCHWQNIPHSPLCVALVTHNFRIVDLLVQHGANIHREINGMTILQRLILNEEEYGLEPLQYALQIGADPNFTTTWIDRTGKNRKTGSLLVMALALGKLQSAQVLLDHPSTDITKSQGVLAVAIEHNLPMEWIHALFSKRKCHSDDLPLETAVRCGRTDAVRLFLQNGADPLRRISFGTILELACSEASVSIIFEFIQAHPALCCNRTTKEEQDVTNSQKGLQFQHGDVRHDVMDGSIMESRDDDESSTRYSSCHSHFSSEERSPGSYSCEWTTLDMQQSNDDDDDDDHVSFYTCVEGFQI